MSNDPQVTLHERKRKTSAKLSTTNDGAISEPQASTSTACNGIKLEDSKLTRLHDLDINMNNCKQEESKGMDDGMP